MSYWYNTWLEDQMKKEQERVHGYSYPSYKDGMKNCQKVISKLWEQYPKKSIRTVQISPYIFVQGEVCNVEVRKEDASGNRRYYATVKVGGNVITGEVFPNLGEENVSYKA